MAEPWALWAKGLKKTYRTGPSTVEVLTGLELEVAPGEFLSVVGPSGSGKSTLLHLLGLMDRFDEGELHLRGRAVSSLTEEDRARARCREIGFVFQFDGMLPEFTILENVLMPARIAAAHGMPVEGAETRAERLLHQLGVGGTKDRFPAHTSGGERQRAAVARALLNRPAVILADEPTGNLDRANGDRVFGDFRRVCRDEGASVILVTHNEEHAKLADRVLRMDNGKLS